jgi:hypothetical protein
MSPELAENMAEAAKKRLSVASMLRRAHLITAVEYADVVDAMRAELGLGPLPEEDRKRIESEVPFV